jgi:hypothetical protein
MLDTTKGVLVTLPGLPPFYDYEWYPQPVEVSPTVTNQQAKTYSAYSQDIKSLPSTTGDLMKTGYE